MSCSSKRNRLVGSCMSTLVSSTKNLMLAGRRVTAEAGLRWVMALLGRGGSRLRGFQRFHELESLLYVAGHFHAAPLARKLATRIEGERAALDAAHLAAVHVLHLDDAEELARRFFGVGQELERKLHFRLEALVRLHAVARHAEDRAFRLVELRIEVAEILALGGAARGVVLGVEVDDDRMAALLGKLEVRAAGAW